MKKEVPVEQLQFGVYISELDRPWTETPFVFQGFVLEDEKQLETLKKYCKKVYVDPEKSADLPERSQLKTGRAVTKPKIESVLASITRRGRLRGKGQRRRRVAGRAGGAGQDRSRAEGRVRHGPVREGHRRASRARSGDEHDRQRRAQSRRDAPALQIEGEKRSLP